MDVEYVLHALRRLIQEDGWASIVTEIDDACVYGPTGLDEGSFRVKWIDGQQYQITVGAIHNPDSPQYIK